MKFEHNIHEYIPKHCSAVFLSILVNVVSKKNSKLVKNEKRFNTRGFIKYVVILCQISFSYFLNWMRRKIFKYFFQISLWVDEFCQKLNINGPQNLENQCTNLYNGLKWPYLWVLKLAINLPWNDFECHFRGSPTGKYDIFGIFLLNVLENSTYEDVLKETVCFDFHLNYLNPRTRQGVSESHSTPRGV